MTESEILNVGIRTCRLWRNGEAPSRLRQFLITAAMGDSLTRDGVRSPRQRPPAAR